MFDPGSVRQPDMDAVAPMADICRIAAFMIEQRWRTFVARVF